MHIQFVLGQLETKTNTEISFSFWLSLFYSIPSLSPHRMTFWLSLFYSIPLLALTDRLTHRGTITLASRGLEEPFLQLFCCVMLVLVLAGTRFLIYCLSVGCAVLAITTGKKKIQSSVWRVVLCNEFVLVLVKIDLKHF